MKKVKVDININIKVDKDNSVSAEEIEELINSYLALDDKEDRYIVIGWANILAKYNREKEIDKLNNRSD